MKSKLNLYLVASLFLLVPNLIISQTGAFGNYEVYTHESNYNSIGYLNIMLALPDYLGSYEIKQKGIMYQNRYNISEITSVNFSDNARFKLFTQGSFRLGLAAGTTETDSVLAGFNTDKLKYYSILIDVFSFGLTPEVTFVFENGYALSAQLGVDLINVGLTFSMMNKGVLSDHAIGHVNVVPFALRPSLFFDFGRKGLGVAFYINPYNVAEYFYGSPKLFKSDDRGIQFTSSVIQKFAVEILFAF